MKRIENLPGFFLCWIVVVYGCATVQHASGFLEDYSVLHEGKYFKQEYVAPGIDFSKYRKIKVNPVELGYFQENDKYRQGELEDLAIRFKEEIETQLDKNYEILTANSRADGETLVVSPALISVGTPHRLVNVATTVFAGPSFTRGSAAFEARLSDGVTGKTVALIAEKRMGAIDAKSLTVGSFTKFTHAEGAFKDWASSLARFLENG